MPIVTLPLVFTTNEDGDFLNKLESRIVDEYKGSAKANLLLQYPVVYIHYWLSNTISYVDNNGVENNINKYDIYVGESNNVIQRTKEHYDNGAFPGRWQHKLVHCAETPKMIVIGHKHFNKSLTLDIENQLIEYFLAMNSIEKIYNGRGNPQNNYYPAEEFNDIFKQIWHHLESLNNDIFLSEARIKDSAIFKASPFKKLTADQINAKGTILNAIRKAVTKKPGQLIFVQGEAGTGKTVLTANIFYELVQMTSEEEFYGLKCHLMVNHDQQLHVYEQMAKRLNLGQDIVSKPTTFINNHDENNKVDISFIDEGHLLLTQGKMSYTGSNQLQDIIDRSKVTVVMFDEYQILTTEEYWEAKELERFKDKSLKQGNYITLNNQLRMHCSQSTKDWLDDLILNRTVTRFKGDRDYEVKSFDTPEKLQSAINAKAENPSTRLSRLVATYDWEYKSDQVPADGGSWGVSIGDWFMPWNYELLKGMSKKELKAIKNLAWAEQKHTINEVGSTFTIQGFDLSYVGVILGPAVKYRDGKVIYDPGENKNDKVTRQRTLQDGSKARFGEMLIRNEVKVLMTRGVSGLYIYAVDDELRAALKNIAKI